jgi:hypothetical protein
MARHEPLLPNAGIVARREYRDRTRSPLFVASTIVLMGLALAVALAPIAIRYFDRLTVTRIAVVTPEDGLATNALAILDQLLNTPPSGQADGEWVPPFTIERADAASSMAMPCCSWNGERRASSRSPTGPTAWATSNAPSW